jgi:hypothetical protein
MKIKLFLKPLDDILKEKEIEININDKHLIEAIVYARQEFQIWRPSNDDIKKLKKVLDNSKH